MKNIILLLFLMLSAGVHSANFCTEAYTGLSCPLMWRLYEPPMFCVTSDGVPQKGCLLTSGAFAYDLRVEEIDIKDCFRVLWFWSKI